MLAFQIMMGSRLFDANKSEEEYFKWRMERSMEFLSAFRNSVSLKGKKVLDFGCGYGPLSKVLYELGAKVYGIDLDKHKLQLAKKLCPREINFRLSGKKKILFNDGFFDAAVLFDVIEHLDNPKDILSEVRRVVRKEGQVLVEFSPFYGFSGPHLWKFTFLPMQLFPKKFVNWYIRKKKPLGFITPEYQLGVYNGLNRMTVKKFKKLLQGFRIEEEHYLIRAPFGNNRIINIDWIRFFPVLRSIVPFGYSAILRKI